MLNLNLPWNRTTTLYRPKDWSYTGTRPLDYFCLQIWTLCLLCSILLPRHSWVSSLIGRRLNSASLSCMYAAAQYLTARAQNSKMFAFPDELAFCRCRLSSKRDMTAGSPDTAEKENYHLILPFSHIFHWNELEADFVGFYAWQKIPSWSVIWHAWKIAYTRSLLRLPRVRDPLWYFSRFNFPKQKDERVRLFFFRLIVMLK